MEATIYRVQRFNGGKGALENLHCKIYSLEPHTDSFAEDIVFVMPPLRFCFSLRSA